MKCGLLRCLAILCVLLFAAPSLHAADAVQAWLQLADNALSDPSLAGDPAAASIVFRQLVIELPSPSQWPALTEALRDRMEAKRSLREQTQYRLLYLLTLYLRSNESVSAAELRHQIDLPADPAQTKPQQAYAAALDEWREAVALRLDDQPGPALVQHLEKEFKRYEPTEKVEVQKILGTPEEYDRFEKLARAMRDQKRYQAAGVALNTNPALLKEEADRFARDHSAEMQHFAPAFANPWIEHYLADQEAAENASSITHAKAAPDLVLPDLVTLLGEAKTRTLLEKAIRLNAMIVIPKGDETRKIAREIALEHVAEMEAPQWYLARSIHATALYNAMNARFPEANPNAGSNPSAEPDRQAAKAYAAAALIVQNQPQKALEVFVRSKTDRIVLPSELLRSLEQAGYQAELWSFLSLVLDRYPVSPHWDELIALAPQVGKTKEMLSIVQLSMERPYQTEVGKFQAKRRLATAALAADNVDQGSTLLTENIHADAKTLDGAREQLDECLQLIRLGRAADRFAWIDIGVAKGQALIKEHAADLDPSEILRFTALLSEMGRYAAAEETLRQVRNDLPFQAGFSSPDLPAHLFAALVAQKKISAAMTLVDNAPDWGYADLGPLLRSHRAPSFDHEQPLGYWAALLLHQNRHDAEATAILENQLALTPDRDSLYPLYIELKGPSAAAEFFQRLAAVDPFQTRPLIWQAQIAFNAGKVNEADQLLQQAIAIDPSDGAQGRGDRMRAYDLLRQVEEKRGNTLRAKNLAALVQAVRQAEDADLFVTGGLTARAIKAYEKALDTFRDAYCIQSRLAVQLAAQGRDQEAALHYRHAYELMPESFGRVESHCLGCEGVFGGNRAQNIAEEVFKSMLKRENPKPQAAYLMGVLRQTQGRSTDALAYFNKAVEADPNYLNAWKHLAEIDRTVTIAEPFRDHIELQLLNLDPASLYSEPNVDSVANIPALWNTARQAAHRCADLPHSDTLLAFPTSAKALRDAHIMEMPDTDLHDKPGLLLLQQKPMEALTAAFGAAARL